MTEKMTYICTNCKHFKIGEFGLELCDLDETPCSDVYRCKYKEEMEDKLIRGVDG